MRAPSYIKIEKINFFSVRHIPCRKATKMPRIHLRSSMTDRFSVSGMIIQCHPVYVLTFTYHLFEVWIRNRWNLVDFYTVQARNLADLPWCLSRSWHWREREVRREWLRWRRTWTSWSRSSSWGRSSARSASRLGPAWCNYGERCRLLGPLRLSLKMFWSKFKNISFRFVSKDNKSIENLMVPTKTI